MQQLADEDGEPVSPAKAVVYQDAWTLALLAERVAVGLALEIDKPHEPTLIAVQREDVILGHGVALSHSRVAGLSTDADAAAEGVERLSPGRATARAADGGRHPLLGDADCGQASLDHVA